MEWVNTLAELMKVKATIEEAFREGQYEVAYFLSDEYAEQERLEKLLMQQLSEQLATTDDD